MDNYVSTENKVNITDGNYNPRLELKEIDGNTLDGQIVYINSQGIEGGGLRNQNDGVSYFGFSKLNVLLNKI